MNLPKPDYAKPLREEYLEFARYFVKAGREIELIDAAVASNHHRGTEYPSWAPWFAHVDAGKFRRTVARMKTAGSTAPVIELGTAVQILWFKERSLTESEEKKSSETQV